MLIRSQDKRIVLVLENTSIISMNMEFGVSMIKANGSLKLGEYETEDKALVVIDEICKACQDGKILFEMP